MAYVSMDVYWIDEKGEEHELPVIFEGNPHWKDFGIGSYEFWGSVENDKRMALICEYIDWDNKLYTKEENEQIDKWLDSNFEKVEEALIKEAGE